MALHVSVSNVQLIQLLVNVLLEHFGMGQLVFLTVAVLVDKFGQGHNVFALRVKTLMERYVSNVSMDKYGIKVLKYVDVQI